jgi:signal transduction histidine kinase
MTRKRPRAAGRRFSSIAAGGAIALILGLVTLVGTTLGHTTDRIGDLAYAVTGTANAHREVLKMETSSRVVTDEGLGSVRRHRAFMEQQLRLSLPGLTDRPDPNPEVPTMQKDLARVDGLLGTDAEVPSALLQVAITELEVSMKHIYDVEEARYFALNNRALKAKATSERFLLTLAGAVAIFGAVLVVGLRRSARANLAQKAAELAAALTELKLAQADRGHLLNETVRASERERVRLAAELHDGPIQALAALCMRLDRATRKLHRESVEAAEPLFSSLRDDLGNEVAALRRVMSELRPPALDESGLGGATHDYVAAFSERTGCASNVTVEVSDGALTEDREVVLYRLVQEALTNVSRHAQASAVAVQLREVNGDVELRVKDNGIGFNAATSSELVRAGHYGLAGMRERVDAAGGMFSVCSNFGDGVEVIASVPANKLAEPVAALA